MSKPNSRSGIHVPPGPRTDRSESVRDFQNLIHPGSVPGFEIFLGPGPVRDLENFPNVFNFK